jgi:hypothetical protein
MTIVTDAGGGIPQTAVPLAAPIVEVDVSVTAAGYASWRFGGIMLRAGYPIELHVGLRRLDDTTAAIEPDGVGSASPSAPSTTNDLPPQDIVIAVTGVVDCRESLKAPFQLRRVSFVDYVRNVLPNEWRVEWPDASLEAGAIAVKEFAWYTAFVQRKWRSQGYPFDLIDSTCDQVYQDGKANSQTDAAIARTWWSWLTTPSGRIFPLYYRSNTDRCPIFPGCMGQVESAELASEGYSAQQILLHFYAPAEFKTINLEPRAYIPLIVR